MAKTIVIAVLLGLTVTVLRTAASDGRKYKVTGTVVDADGAPVASARVTVMAISGKGSAGQLLSTAVDSNGKFQLALPPGRYVIRAKDEAQGYPDPNFLLSADPTARFPEITVQNTNIFGLKVILGAKGGLVEGLLRDNVTLQPIPNGKVVLRDATNPDIFVEITTDNHGRFAFVVPSKQILVTATAPGYLAMSLANARQLSLSGGERRDITIGLQPK